MVSPDFLYPGDSHGRARYRGDRACVDGIVTWVRFFPFGLFFLRPGRVGDRCRHDPRRDVDGRVRGGVEDGP